MSFDALEGLDSCQKDAAACLENSVVAAGAGSGKTRVLAARYTWLVTEKGFPVDRIVTLTFTQKAVTEMFSRIYTELCRAAPHSEAARRAVEDFHTARISTLDAYCASIAKNAARHFGLSPDFSIDPTGVCDLVRQEALPFIIQNRTNPALKLLLGAKNLEAVIDGLFVKTFTEYATLSRPIDFAAVLCAQRKEILKQWATQSTDMVHSLQAARADFDSMSDASAQKSAVYNSLKNVFETIPYDFDIPDEPEFEALFKTKVDENANQNDVFLRISVFLNALFRFTRVPFSGKTTHETLIHIKALRDEIKEHYKLFASVANYLLYFDIPRTLFTLLTEFQDKINRQKRLAGKLTFLDVSTLALDVLLRFPEIRQTEKNSVSAVMIDEFQDNNASQRDLLFLLAEQLDFCGKGVPSAENVCADKLFFVGDEKQSIYKFRGAEVSVFRKLTTDLGSGANMKNLAITYRSHPDLIAFFNCFFSQVFLNPAEETVPDYEAEYSSVQCAPSLEHEVGKGARVHFYIYNAENSNTEEAESDDDNEFSEEREAAFTAKKIRELVTNEYQVFQNEKGRAVYRSCTYADFAILFRSYAKQHLFEKQLRTNGVPYTCENIAGFFNDAPVNDVYNLLRLVVYPLDSNAYASVLCAPFAGLSRPAMLACLSALEPQLEKQAAPFAPESEVFLTAEETLRYQNCRILYENLCKAHNSLTTAEMVSYVWYEAGFRFETLWNESVQLYAELYDYFFELARQADAEGLSLIGFIDRIAHVKASGERIDDTDIPADRAVGVRLMSIHKSKGLEFPIVFVCGTDNHGKNLQNTDVCFFDAENGFSLNVPPHPLLPADKTAGPGNYFFNIQKALEEQKNTAELRRLLYVAFTRAESAIFVTGKFKIDKKKLEPDATLFDIVRILAQKESRARSFLDLILPVLAQTQSDGLYTLDVLPELDDRAQAEVLTKETAFERAKIHYETSPELPIRKPQQTTFAPSALFSGERTVLNQYRVSDSIDTTVVDRIVEEAAGAFTYADFGTIAHAHMEALLNNTTPLIPARIAAQLTETQSAVLSQIARAMANQFSQSALGLNVKQSEWFKTEFAFKSRIEQPSARKGFVFLNGKIDLVFEHHGQLFVVDFKTDLFEDSRHTAQLAVYSHAAAEIFNKPARCLLYYLRTGNTVDLTEEAQKVPLKELFY